MTNGMKMAALLGAALLASLGTAGLVVVLTNGTGYPGSGQRAGEQSEPVLTVEGYDLLQDYLSNEIAANQKYTDKVIKVGGHVDSVTPEVLFLRVAVGGSEAPRAPSIICHIAPGLANEFASFRSGQGAYVIGLCEGASRYEGVPGYGELVVVLKDCRPASGGTGSR